MQIRVNNLSIQKRKMSCARFKVKQRNIFGLALIDTGNLVQSALVLGAFWKSIGGKISSSMDYKVGLQMVKVTAYKFLEPLVYSIYQPLRHIPVYTDAVWINQPRDCVQQDAGRSHEGGGLRLLASYLDNILTYSGEPWPI